MGKIVSVFKDIVEKNGKTIEQNNLEKPRKFKVGDEVIFQIETTINEVGIDCDGTVLYDAGIIGDCWGEDYFKFPSSPKSNLEKEMMKTHNCPTCNSPVKIVGKTTMHYEPVVLSEDEIYDILDRYTSKPTYESGSTDLYKASSVIHKAMRGEK